MTSPIWSRNLGTQQPQNKDHMLYLWFCKRQDLWTLSDVYAWKDYTDDVVKLVTWPWCNLQTWYKIRIRLNVPSTISRRFLDGLAAVITWHTITCRCRNLRLYYSATFNVVRTSSKKKNNSWWYQHCTIAILKTFTWHI